MKTEISMREINDLRRERGQKPLHQCDACGKLGEWSDSWKWYGSYREQDATGIVVKFCGSPDCTYDGRSPDVMLVEKRARQ